MADIAKPALDWLRYGSYVDERRRILYVETPKCGCSSIKYLLRGNVPLHFNPAAPESRLDMMIHDRGQTALRPLTDYQPDQAQDIARGEGWFRFAVTRHPAERFFSAWRDKIFLCEPGFDSYVPRDGRRFVEFSEFCARVFAGDNPLNCDPHWRAQTALLQPDEIAYTRLYDIAELGSLPDDLARHFAALGIENDLTPMRRVNESLPVKPDGFITPDVLLALRDFYRADFERLAFPEFALSWAPPRRAAELVTPFTDAIFDRNRTLAAYNAWSRMVLTPR